MEIGGDFVIRSSSMLTKPWCVVSGAGGVSCNARTSAGGALALRTVRLRAVERVECELCGRPAMLGIDVVTGAALVRADVHLA